MTAPCHSGGIFFRTTSRQTFPPRCKDLKRSFQDDTLGVIAKTMLPPEALRLLGNTRCSSSVRPRRVNLTLTFPHRNYSKRSLGKRALSARSVYQRLLKTSCRRIQRIKRIILRLFAVDASEGIAGGQGLPLAGYHPRRHPDSSIFAKISFRILAPAAAVMRSGSRLGLNSTMSAPTTGASRA